VPGFVATLQSSMRGQILQVPAATRAEALRLARDLLLEAENREHEKFWFPVEVISVQVGLDPERP
jgi:hypothetical protein